MIAVYVLLRGGVFKQGESYYDSWDLFLILSMSHFVTLGQTSVCSSGTRLLYRNRNLSYFGALWSLINICRILWGAQRKLVTNIDSFSQSTYTLPTKKPSVSLILRQGFEIIGYTFCLIYCALLATNCVCERSLSNSIHSHEFVSK